MPQDGFKSAVYRSFVKCDDPKGVSECKTMRKSKTNSSSFESVYESKTTTNDLNYSPPQNTGKGKKIDFKYISQQESSAKTSSLHLKEVSREAHKLNKAIDTYSNGMRFDHNSKEIANNLLKGALDLQDSLMVLGKLQEASHYMAKFRKKPKEKYKDDKKEENTRLEKSKSEKYASYSNQTGFEKPRFSVDGSSRDCFDELRTVIRDSLARQNLLPPNFHEKTNFHGKANIHEKTNFHEKKNFPEGKILDSIMDIPSTSSTQSSTMNFISFTSSNNSCSSDSTKRLKGSNLIAKLMGLEGIHSPQAFISSPKRYEIETISGPRRPNFEIDMTKVKKSQLDAYKEDNEETKLRNIVDTMRYKGLFKGNSSKGSSDQSNYSVSSYNKNYLFEDSPPIVIMKPLDVSKAEPEENDLQKLVRKSGKKDTNKGAVDFDEVCRKLIGEGTPIKKHGFREFKEKEFSNKLKNSGFVDTKEKKKRFERMDKLNETKKKLMEVENSKSKTASKSRDQAKVKSIKEMKIETEPISRRRSVSPIKSSPPLIVSKNKPPLSRKGGNRKKNQKLDIELVVNPLVEEDVERKHGEAQIDQSREIESEQMSTSILAKEEENAHLNPIKDKLQNSKLETIAESDEEASYNLNNHTNTVDRSFYKQNKEKKLFLTSPSFLKCAEELFDIETNLKTLISNDPEIVDTRLLLDIANELMLQKKTNSQAARLPFLSPITTKISLPLTQLIDDVCKGIDDFSKYNENGNDKPITETLNSILKRDLLGTGLANGAWESGWKNGYCFDEIEKVVGDVEKCVFDELIEGMFTDFPQLAFSYLCI